MPIYVPNPILASGFQDNDVCDINGLSTFSLIANKSVSQSAPTFLSTYASGAKEAFRSIFNIPECFEHYWRGHDSTTCQSIMQSDGRYFLPRWFGQAEDIDDFVDLGAKMVSINCSPCCVNVMKGANHYLEGRENEEISVHESFKLTKLYYDLTVATAHAGLQYWQPLPADFVNLIIDKSRNMPFRLSMILRARSKHFNSRFFFISLSYSLLLFQSVSIEPRRRWRPYIRPTFKRPKTTL